LQVNNIGSGRQKGPPRRDPVKTGAAKWRERMEAGGGGRG